MKSFLKTKVGLISVCGFLFMMGIVFHHVSSQRKVREAHATPAVPATGGPMAAAASSAPTEVPTRNPVPVAEHPTWTAVAENAAYLEPYYGLDKRAREDQDRLGNPVTRRENASTPSDLDHGSQTDEPPMVSPAQPVRTTLRLQGHVTTAISPGPAPSTEGLRVLTAKLPPFASASGVAAANEAAAAHPILTAPTSARPRPKRFNPYGSVIKCELVFTIDSAAEEAPLIGLVMEPVYNNGSTVIPAGAELHGFVRPDRVRDRLYSDQQWVLVFPREHGRPNGRQLNVRGVALDRVEPEATGMTWGLTDGSYGIEGTVLRSMGDAEIRRFVATFLAEGAVALQSKQTDALGQETARNTPQNAVMQGIGANLQQIAADISAEIAKHGVFIRVPAGHQFYFYPLQLIDADAADISSDIATVK